jgi:pimeloyl-ACP methyl ester carboxylesterase
MPALAEAGFHAIALNMQGYGESEGPVGNENYTSFHVVGDIIGVLDALGEKQVPSYLIHTPSPEFFLSRSD